MADALSTEMGDDRNAGGMGLSSVIAAVGMFPSLASAIVTVAILWALAVASISFYSLLVLWQPARS